MSVAHKTTKVILLSCAAAALIMLLASGVGYRNGWWDLGLAFNLIRYAFYVAATVGLLSAVVVVVKLKSQHRLDIALISTFVVTLACSAYVYHMRTQAYSLPPIHDITTDTVDVPQFNAIVALRADAPNSLDYGGPDIAQQQQRAYPTVAPIITLLNTQQAHDRALALAKSYRGWQVVSSDQQQGRIEVTVTTFWFGFKDDLVIRIRETAQGTRLDLRSVSRLGVSDVGANAKRIIRFIEGFNS